MADPFFGIHLSSAFGKLPDYKCSSIFSQYAVQAKKAGKTDIFPFFYIYMA